MDENETKPQTAELVGVSDLIKTDFPPVSDNVVKTFVENAPKTAESPDLAGYNPAIHESPPRKNKRGEWAKKRGNKKGYDFNSKMNLPPDNIGEQKPENAPENGTPAPENAPENGPAGLEISTEQAAAVCSSLFFFGLNKFSDYDAPEKERETHKAACYDYLISTGGVNLPPWGMLACVSAQSIMNACQQPKAKTRFQKIKEWFVVKIYGWKNRHRNGMQESAQTASTEGEAGQ